MNYCEKTVRKQNPKDRANIFGLVTFSYTYGLFLKAFKSDLQENDIYEVIKPCRSKENGDRLESNIFRERKRKSPSFIHLLWVTFGTRYIILGVFRLVSKLVVSVVEPEAISKLVLYFNPSQNDLTFNDAFYYAVLIVLVRLYEVFTFQNYVLFLQQLAIQVRSSFCSLIYRKALRLTPEAMNEISLGNIITLITKDSLVFENAIFIFNDMWMELIKLIVICYLIYNKMGASSFLGLAVLLLGIPLQAILGRYMKKLRLELTHKTDERLQTTQETLSAIKVIKMYTWEKVFAKKVEAKRMKEMTLLMKYYYLQSVNFITGLISIRLSFYALIMAYIYYNTETQTEVIFYVMKCFGDLRVIFGFIVPNGINKAAALITTFKRISRVLNSEELDVTSKKSYDKPKVKLSDVTVKIKQKEILKNISLELRSGLTVVTGPLSSGKSSLLKLLLQDYPVTSGKLLSRGSFSYCSQDPWLFPSSIKQNILFGQPYEEARYNEVIRVCALQYDFALFERGDDTIVSDRGMNLSGGQQARINLARAVYRKTDIYLLDDPLNSLDAKVQEYIYQNCIKKFLKDQQCILVTHNLNHKNNAGQLIVMLRGEIVFDGKPEDIKTEIMQELNMDQSKEKVSRDQDENDNVDASTALLNNSFEKKKLYGEIQKEGKVNLDVYRKYVAFGGGMLIISVIFGLYVIAEFSDSYSSRIITNWVNINQNITNILASRSYSSNYTISNSSRILIKPLNTTKEDKHITSVMFNQSLEMFSNGFHRNAVLDNLYYQASWWLKIYTAILVACIAIDLIRKFLFVNFVRKASINLHNLMIESMVKAKMNFFDTYFIGNILNRFSQDLTIVDDRLPISLSVFAESLLAALGLSALITTVSWHFSVPAGFLFLLLISLRFFYMPTSRSLQRLESASRSPLIGHLNASMEGVTTIRAFGVQKIIEEEFDRHQDLYSSAHFMTFSVRRAFSFIMEISSTTFVVMIIGKFLFFPGGVSSGDVGLAITVVVSLSQMLQWVLLVSTDAENNMISVERALEYTEVPQERYDGRTLQHWPSTGTVTYRDVSLAYRDEKVLKNLNFQVMSKEKIGIVGRTGAGKSSILSTLFRLYEFEGEILIDGVSTKTLSLDLLRDKISIIPQEPLLFQGTVRQNIDPFNRYTDEEIWTALKKVHMKEYINSLELLITDYGSNFSAGQKQLVSLARALIRKNKIVVLDEATSNMDPETEVLAQKVIIEHFCDCTVLIIAHRLQSVMDCNKIIVMDKGELVEFDDPVNLLNTKGSRFRNMLLTTDAHILS